MKLECPPGPDEKQNRQVVQAVLDPSDDAGFGIGRAAVELTAVRAGRASE